MRVSARPAGRQRSSIRGELKPANTSMHLSVELSRTARADQALLIDLDGSQAPTFAFDAQAHCECLCARRCRQIPLSRH